MATYRARLRELQRLGERFSDDVHIEVTNHDHLKVILTTPDGRSRFVICSKTPRAPGLGKTAALLRRAAQELGLKEKSHA